MSHFSSENSGSLNRDTLIRDYNELAVDARNSKSYFALVVEDDPVVVDLIQSIIAKLGLGVIVAEDAGEALRIFRESKDVVRCVILDYGIPGMDASRLVLCLREIHDDVKVLLSSGYSRSFISRDFPMDEVCAFIPKPYEPQLLVDTILGMLEPEVTRA